MATVTDYNDLTSDLVALLQSNVVDGDGNAADRVDTEELDLHRGLNKRRHLNVRLVGSDDKVRVGQQYYVTITYEIDVAAYDLSSYRTAVIVRNDLVRSTKEVLRENAKFSAENDSLRTTVTGFDGGQVERGFIAEAVVVIEVDRFENA